MSHRPPVQMSMDKGVCYMQTGEIGPAYREAAPSGEGSGAEEVCGLPPRGPMGLAECSSNRKRTELVHRLETG